jgi:coenzyme F420-reducing hydrogenase beta subunit
MKKVGIMTFHKAINYGAVLQAYALSQYINKVGGNAEVINYNSHLYDHYVLKKNSNPIINFLYMINRIYVNKKYKKFNQFVSNYIPLSNANYSTENINQTFIDEYDIYFTGSDQVWNPEIVGNEKAFLLDFINNNKKKYSYAASIGLDSLSENISNEYSRLISCFSGIAVRETKAVDILKNIGVDKVCTVCDPTLLLNDKEWIKIEKKIKTPKKYILVFSFGKDVDLWVSAKKMAKLTGYTICTLNDSFINSKNIKQFKGIGPREWIYLIHNAECIFTNSFHGLMFSIIFKKDFWVSDPKDGTNSRIIEILERANQLDRIINHPKDSSILNRINYDEFSRNFDEYITFSKNYIDSVINDKYINFNINYTMKKKCNYIELSNQCNGCTACMNICPVNAIKMVEDGKLSYYPEINKDTCIDCGKCKKACSYLNKIEKNSDFKQEYYGLKIKDKELLNKCSSGGAFILLAKSILNNNGIVYGVGYDNLFHTKYIRVEDITDLYAIVGTKYVDCNKGDVFLQVKRDLNNGKQVLFTGTPCTCAGLKNILTDNEKTNIYLMDIICHGTPVTKVYDDYLYFLENKYSSKIKSINFRKKIYDSKLQKYIKTQNLEIVFTNGKKIEADKDTDPYYRLFWTNNIIRESCFSCQFCSLDRVSDITIGDYWGNKDVDAEFFRENSESSVLINTNKGKKLFERIKKEAFTIKVNKKDIMQRNLFSPTPKSNNYDVFWIDYMQHSFKYILFRYADYFHIFKFIRRIKHEK